MIKVIVIGTGNVGSHLATVFLNTPNIELVQLYNRSSEALKQFEDKVPVTSKIEDLLEADVYLISVSDSAIEAVSNTLKFTGRLVVHTSGSTPMNILNSSNRRGVFYPLQTFTKSKELLFKNIPLCIESDSNKDLIFLESLASLISDHVYILDSEQRLKMHIGAVFVNNFVNYMYQLGSEICENNKVPFEILHPLIQETSEKIQSLTPLQAQTGPARRKDLKTIDSQMSQLSDAHSKIYKILTDAIIKIYS